MLIDCAMNNAPVDAKNTTGLHLKFSSWRARGVKNSPFGVRFCEAWRVDWHCWMCFASQGTRTLRLTFLLVSVPPWSLSCWSIPGHNQLFAQKRTTPPPPPTTTTTTDGMWVDAPVTANHWVHSNVCFKRQFSSPVRFFWFTACTQTSGPLVDWVLATPSPVTSNLPLCGVWLLLKTKLLTPPSTGQPTLTWPSHSRKPMNVPIFSNRKSM